MLGECVSGAGASWDDGRRACNMRSEAVWVLAALVIATASGSSTTLKKVIIDPSNDKDEWTTDEYYIPDGQKSGELNYDDNYNFCNSDQILVDLKVKVEDFLGQPPLVEVSEDLKTVRMYRQPAGARHDGQAFITLTGHCYGNS